MEQTPISNSEAPEENPQTVTSAPNLPITTLSPADQGMYTASASQGWHSSSLSGPPGISYDPYDRTHQNLGQSATRPNFQENYPQGSGPQELASIQASAPSSMTMSTMAHALPDVSGSSSRPHITPQPNRYPMNQLPNSMMYQHPQAGAYGPYNYAAVPSGYSYPNQMANPAPNTYPGMISPNQSFASGSTIHSPTYGTGWISPHQTPMYGYPQNYQVPQGYPEVAYQDAYGNRMVPESAQRNHQVPHTNVRSAHRGSGSPNSQAQHLSARLNTNPGMGSRQADAAQSARLRGPPRKAKQSPFALWVGNLPRDTHIIDLKEHLSRGAKQDILSVRLFSSSNCAFVNYKTESACAAALERFNGSSFKNVKLSCRLRGSGMESSKLSKKDAASTLASSFPSDAIEVAADGQEGKEAQTGSIEQAAQPEGDSANPSGTSGQDSTTTTEIPVTTSTTPTPPGPSSERIEKPRDRYFIMKSLTVQDLEESVWTNVWATQPHNESALNEAFEKAESVYLIFGANKTGEYFGYARMASAISKTSGPPQEPTSQSLAAPTADVPQDIPTPETEFAPKGHIHDDRDRGNLFWEIESDDTTGPDADVQDQPSDKSEGEDEGLAPEATIGNIFKVDWISTEKVPFHYTRGLRNSWNHNREVKIARDGTELETSVGRRVVQLFHRSQSSGSLRPGTNPSSYRPGAGHPRGHQYS